MHPAANELAKEPPITGFSLFVLCHHFGRRGRAMVSSIAKQRDCPVPLHLNVFYSRAEDAHLIVDGAVDGPAPPRLTLIHVPENRIMQRAMHFSEAHLMHTLSHTVFCDADLWFPPLFWRSYAEALRAESMGYWSCRIRDIPYEPSEAALEQWRDLAESDLEGRVSNIRHDVWQGSVGVFQCIPRTLVAYPQDSRSSVEGMDLRFSELAKQQSLNHRLERRVGSLYAYHFNHPPCWTGTGGVQL
jgi:hypothetical protein